MRIGTTVAVLCVASSFPTFLNGCDKKEKDKQDKSENTKGAKSAEKSKQKNKEPASPAKKTSTIAVKKVHSLETDHHPEGISSSSTRLERQTGGEEDELGSATLDNEGDVEVPDITECRESLQEVIGRFQRNVESLEGKQKLEEKVTEANEEIEGLCLEHSNVDEVKRLKNEALSLLDHIVGIANRREGLKNVRQDFWDNYMEMFNNLSGSQSELKDAPQRFNQLVEKVASSCKMIRGDLHSAELDMEMASLTKLIKQASNQWNTFLTTSGEIWRIGTKAIDDIRSKPAQADATQQRVDKIAQTAIDSIGNIIGQNKSRSGWEALIVEINNVKKSVLKSVVSPEADWNSVKRSALIDARKAIKDKVFMASTQAELEKEATTLTTIGESKLAQAQAPPKITVTPQMKAELQSMIDQLIQVGKRVGTILIHSSSEFASKKTHAEIDALVNVKKQTIQKELDILGDKKDLVESAFQRVESLAEIAKKKRNSTLQNPGGPAAGVLTEVKKQVDMDIEKFAKAIATLPEIDQAIDKINTNIQTILQKGSISAPDQKQILDEAKAKLGKIATAHLAPTEVHAELNQVEYPAEPGVVEAVKDKVINEMKVQHTNLHIDTKIVQDLIDTEVKKAETCVTELKKGTYNQQIFSLLYPEVEKKQATN